MLRIATDIETVYNSRTAQLHVTARMRTTRLSAKYHDLATHQYGPPAGYLSLPEMSPWWQQHMRLTSSGEVTNRAVVLVAACVASVCAAWSGFNTCTAGEGGAPLGAGAPTDCAE